MCVPQAETELHVELRLVGLAVMANPLRPDTADVISKLQHATIRTVMVGGPGCWGGAQNLWVCLVPSSPQVFVAVCMALVRFAQPLFLLCSAGYR